MMKTWINLCLFIVCDHGIGGEVNILPLLTSSALLNTYASGMEYWDLPGFAYPRISNAFGGARALAKL